jgi:hypothetical protein
MQYTARRIEAAWFVWKVEHPPPTPTHQTQPNGKRFRQAGVGGAGAYVGLMLVTHPFTVLPALNMIFFFGQFI